MQIQASATGVLHTLQFARIKFPTKQQPAVLQQGSYVAWK